MSRRKPGLWHGPRRVEIENVKSAHRTPCLACNKLPTGRRMVITEGAGRSGKKFVLCALHAEEWIYARRDESTRAIAFLGGSNTSIRVEGPDPIWMENLKIREAEAQERKKEKQANLSLGSPMVVSLSQAINHVIPRRRLAP